MSGKASQHRTARQALFGALAAVVTALALTLVTGVAPAAAASHFTKAPVPTISGTLKVGAKLTAKPGTWKPKATLKYRWYRDGAAIKGATKRTYTLTGADRGHRVKVKVTGSRKGYVSVSKTSKATKKVASGTFTAAPAPTIAGAVKVGSTLTAVTGTWRPVAKFAYQWYRGATAIKGAIAATYRLTNADAGASLTVKVVGSRAGYVSVAKTSARAGTVTGGVITAGTPTVMGEAKVWQTVTVKPGTWSPAGVALRYQWKAGGVAIPGATGASFTPTFDQLGAALTVTVTGSKSSFTTRAVTSAAVTVRAPSVLGKDQTLPAGKELRSPNGAYSLVMQTDGNLVQYGPSGAVWASGGSDANRAVMQSDGNLVLYNAANAARWESGSWGAGVTYLSVQDDGNLVIYDTAGTAVWARNVVGWISVYPGSTANGQPGTQSQSAPNLTSTLFRVYPVGKRLPVVCGVTNGQAVDGSATPGTGKSATWHRLLLGDWVPDADFRTTVDGLVPRGVIGFVASEPNCNGSPGTSTSLPGINGWVFPIQPHSSLTTYSGHNGDDFPVGIGTPVYAMYGGTVSFPAPYKVTSSWCPVPSAIGRTQQDLIVTSTRDGNTYRFDYAHMNSFNVANGQNVNAGDLLGYSGDKGCVTGPHLHVDIKLNGQANRVYPHDLIGWRY